MCKQESNNNQYLIKAENNLCAADMSLKNNYFDVAIGRYYYHFFLLAKNYLISTCGYTEDYLYQKGKPVHSWIRNVLRKAYNTSKIRQLSDDEFTDMMIYLEDLFKLRVKAEYTRYEFDLHKYNSNCKIIIKKLNEYFVKSTIKEST